MPNKRERHLAIQAIVEMTAVQSQDELRRLLRERGCEVTQSTLSRDLHQLRLARIPTGDGVRYAFTDGGVATEEDDRGALDHLLPQFFDKVDGTGELVVLHTMAGGAQPVAAAIDSEGWHDILGTIAGDDTILLVCRSAEARVRVIRRLAVIAGDR
ncbi:MAG TPA: arginine repressor [Gemmatimonadaceae bacterium]|nr:arginine repressor [Gemmatimonadaceae bacterium]